MIVAWGNRVGPQFRQRMLEMCFNLRWYWNQAPSDAMSCMAFETGRTFSPSMANAAGSGAVGLIQFMPPTADGLGTTTAALRRMTAVQQLDYVEAYFKPYAARIHSLHDMYLAILLPKYIDADDNAVLFSDGSTAYRQNSGFDANSDGKITKAEVCARVDKMKAEGLQAPNVYEGD